MSADVPRIVALLGATGSGKSIVARQLIAAGFQRIRFADPVRDMLAAGFGCNEDEIDGEHRSQPQRRFGGQCVQTMMNTLIYDWGRSAIHQDLFANEWRRRVDLHRGNILVDDLNRPNEAAAVRDAGGIIVRITRPDFNPPQQGLVRQHARITSDLELINDSKARLALAAEQFVNSINSLPARAT